MHVWLSGSEDMSQSAQQHPFWQIRVMSAMDGKLLCRRYILIAGSSVAVVLKEGYGWPAIGYCLFNLAVCGLRLLLSCVVGVLKPFLPVLSARIYTTKRHFSAIPCLGGEHAQVLMPELDIPCPNMFQASLHAACSAHVPCDSWIPHFI
jgi:hypothetical protein